MRTLNEVAEQESTENCEVLLVKKSDVEKVKELIKKRKAYVGDSDYGLGMMDALKILKLSSKRYG